MFLSLQDLASIRIPALFGIIRRQLRHITLCTCKFAFRPHRGRTAEGRQADVLV